MRASEAPLESCSIATYPQSTGTCTLDLRHSKPKNQALVDQLRAQSAIRRADKAKTAATEVPDPLPAQLEPFNADTILDYSFRDEVDTMVIPIYSLAKYPSCEKWRWESHDGKSFVEITSEFLSEQLDVYAEPKPGEVRPGRATIFDKDVVIYSISKINEAINRGLDVGPVIRFTLYDFLKATHRSSGGNDYKNMLGTCRRLRSTNVETNVIGSDDGQTTKIQGIIDEAELKRDSTGKLEYVEVKLASWLFSAVKNRHVLAINPLYFELGPLERAVYGIARRHVGNKGMWPIELQKLKDKCGSGPNSPLRRFLFDIKKIIVSDSIPDYRLTVSPVKNGERKVTFYCKNSEELVKKLSKKIKKSIP